VKGQGLIIYHVSIFRSRCQSACAAILVMNHDRIPLELAIRIPLQKCRKVVDRTAKQ